MLEMPRAMRTRLLWCITLYLLCHPRVWGQPVTTQFPPQPAASQSAAAPAPVPSTTAELPDDPALESTLPEAHVVPQPEPGVPVKIVADTQKREQTRAGVVYTLDGNVVFYYRQYIVHADHVTYNEDTGDVVARGHLMIDGGDDDEHFVASHGTLNVKNDTGDFFNVVGTLGVEQRARGRMVFTAPNPFALSGLEVLQLGRGHYKVIHGSMTSCRLPKPDWRILAHTIELNQGMASTKNGMFELLRVPVFYLPYMTHPVSEQRESGILLPFIGNNTTKGFIFGEGFYLTLGRSADVTLASQFYSKRGWAPNGVFRYRGLGQNFGNVHFTSLLDRGLPVGGGKRVNQGGVDLGADGRYDFGPDTRAVVDAEYLSSYIYRLVFEEDYALAINSEVKSQAFVTHQDRDTWVSVRMNRYQNFQSASTPGDEVRILHLPVIDFDAADRRLGGAESRSPVFWGLRGSAGALSRFEYPNFRTSAEIPRLDFYPRASMPLHFAGWTFRPDVAFRETWYGKSQFPANLEQIPVVRKEGIARTDVEAGFELRPPALERDFASPWLVHLLGGELRHTIEPDLRYRYVSGINNFQQIIRFDETDVASDTNEAEYGLTQRLFLRHLRPHPCRGDEALSPPRANEGRVGDPGRGPEAMCGGGSADWITWRVAQKYYFEPGFNHAITPGTPNPLETTLDFTGVDFLTEPRHNTPVISRLRWRTTSATDAEWDLDYDVREGKITSSNVYTSYQRGFYRFYVGDSYVNVPLGYTPLSTIRPKALLSPDAQSSYHQVHASIVYGGAKKLGPSAGVTTAYDFVHNQLQYGAIQGTWNWNCCGFSFQYRRFSLGSIRDDTEYFYSLNFAGFGNVGDLTHRNTIF
jgi:LPS-assembly protein